MQEMTYEKARDYLNHAAKKGIILGLTVMEELLKRLDHPEKSLRVVHIAGTNGKGSILTYMEQIFLASGYSTGRYVSPAVGAYEERFLLNGKPIDKDAIPACVEKVKKAAALLEEETGYTPTVFEIETAMAFLFFQEAKVSIVFLETGMGGRLDATNVIEKPFLSVIASVSHDHLGILGNNLTEIAIEKAGIIKESCNTLLYPMNPEEVKRIIYDTCREKGSICHEVDLSRLKILEEGIDGSVFSYGRYQKLEIALPGRHQIYNAVTAVEAVEILKKWFCISEFHIEEGLRQARWQARLEKISEKPLIYLDGAHNEDAAKRLGEFVAAHFREKRVLALVGVLADKEYDKIMAHVLPYVSKTATMTPDNERALSSKELLKTVKKYCKDAIDVKTVKQGLDWALEEAGEDDVVLIFGSLSFMGEIREYYGKISKNYQA